MLVVTHERKTHGSWAPEIQNGGTLKARRLTREFRSLPELPLQPWKVGVPSVRQFELFRETLLRSSLIRHSFASEHSALPDYEEVQRSLEEVCEEASSDNWDGYGALPANPSAYRYAIDFIKVLPPFPEPEVGVDPDGEIGLDWENDGQVYSLSVGENGRLSYAATFRDGKAHGTEQFQGRIPRRILQDLNRLFSRQE